jgi:hypothetical protein
MNTSPCPICHSVDVDEYADDGSPVLWGFCHNCSHTWIRRFGTETLDLGRGGVVRSIHTPGGDLGSSTH